ncbi:unnamed protein product [Prorocentrum cordatum]|uniref:Ketosynthase family 3 (KS3) domain-containing protein n=2 Tax=Prorocentrum cordatum TaxID=2364126 RepID=A0ABN9UGF8_9DINO|nr:unnamed protein product [Polarella glacialis]
MALVRGMLVEVSGLPIPAQPAPEAGDVEPMDLNGARAQLVSLDREAGKWTAVTFDGHVVAVDPRYLRELDGDQLAGYDFVLGPATDVDVVGHSLAECLASQGYAVVKLFVSADDAADLLSATKQLEDDGHFERLAVEFERGYLGRNCSAKTLLLDPSAASAPNYVRDSPLWVMDSNVGSISEILSPHSQDVLGFSIYSRTSILITKPLTADDEQRYIPAEADDGDAEGYLHTMFRRVLSLLQFVGPGEGTLRLFPRETSGREVTLRTEPHTLVLVSTAHFEYEHKMARDSLTLASFFLREPAVFSIDTVEADAEQLLRSLGSGLTPPPGEKITIQGMYCRYGGHADGSDRFWTGLCQGGTDGITEIPELRWDNTPYYDPDMSFGGAYCKHGCFGIPGVDLFDCKFFEVSVAEAKTMDPVQRQVLEVSYMALVETGYDKTSLQRKPENIGHFVGIDKDDWLCMSAAGAISLDGVHGAAGAANAITSNRFSYALNLKGTSMTIDTACSSSLVCIHVSKLHLRNKENEPMPASIVNGLNLMLYPGPFIGCCAAGMLSHNGRCFTFDKSADGYTRGELCGALGFKPSQKFDNGENMYGLVAGTFSNQDGRSATMTAPNGPAQEKCIQGVLREAKLSAADIDCFECHGTGTALGDPIEVGSFRKAMSGTDRQRPVVISSSKSSIAHGEGGAGLAGFFKCVCQVAHAEASSGLHLRARNPHLDVEGFPVQMLTEMTVMAHDNTYCGVSSFGFGGTNAHGQAWGMNIYTSRGAIRQSRDVNRTFERRLMAAPPAEITMNGDDVTEWDTTGIDPRAEANSKWKIDLDDDGVATWEKDDALEDLGEEFFIQGDHNNWEPDGFEKSDSIQGLWIARVVLGSSGEAQFQIICDGDSDRVIHPRLPRCTMKAVKIEGPAKTGRDLSWCILGEPGETYKVEFFHQDSHMSISWLRSAG